MVYNTAHVGHRFLLLYKVQKPIKNKNKNKNNVDNPTNTGSILGLGVELDNVAPLRNKTRI